MKKISAFLLVLVMVFTVISTCIVATSAAGNQLVKTYEAAAEGDLLYEFKFGETEGVFKSGIFAAATNDPSAFIATTISADKRTITLDYTPTKAQRLYYGGEVEGLTLGAGKSYTITMKVKYDEGNSNAGVYFNYPNSFASDDLAQRMEYDNIRGHYGTPDVRNTLAIGGSKATGKYVSTDNDYLTASFGGFVENSAGFVFARDAEGFHDVALEVEGNRYRVYINNILFDEGGMPDESIAVAGKVGYCIYLYNAGAFTAKDVNLYKGAIKKNSTTKPSYAVDKAENPNSTNKLLKTYAEAADGDLLYAVNFNATDGVYVPTIIRNYAAKGTYASSATAVPYATYPLVTWETPADGSGVKFTNAGNDGAFWWGNIIEGLKIDATTKYTYEYKAASFIAGKQGGLGFVTDPDQLVVNCFNFYGRWTTIGESSAQVVIERNSGKIAGELIGSTDYVPIFPKSDADGYVNIKIELDGYKFYCYYECEYEEGGTNWTLFECYDMTEKLSVRDNNLACMFYIYNANTVQGFKDVKIYKGLLTPKASSEEETTTEQVTTTEKPAETTTPAAATTPSTPVTTPSVTTAAPKSGCGSTVAGSLAVIAIVSLAGVVISKKN